MYPNTEHISHEFTMTNGKQADNFKINNSYGDIIAAFIIVDDPTKLPNGFVNISLTTNSNTPLVHAADVKAWALRQGGDYLNAAKPAFIQENEFKAHINSTNPFTNDVSFQLVTIHKKEC